MLLCLYLDDLDVYPDAGRQESETTMAVQSLGAAAQNMLLAAYDLGLDAGWMCAPLFCPEEVVEALALDQKLVPHALLTLGLRRGRPPEAPGTAAARRPCGLQGLRAQRVAGGRPHAPACLRFGIIAGSDNLEGAAGLEKR